MGVDLPQPAATAARRTDIWCKSKARIGGCVESRLIQKILCFDRKSYGTNFNFGNTTDLLGASIADASSSLAEAFIVGPY
jgi:hypothetical protein